MAGESDKKEATLTREVCGERTKKKKKKKKKKNSNTNTNNSNIKQDKSVAAACADCQLVTHAKGSVASKTYMLNSVILQHMQMSAHAFGAQNDLIAHGKRSAPADTAGAPAHSKWMTMSKYPFAAAISIGDCPHRSRVCTSAQWQISSTTDFEQPPNAAQWSGVWLLWSKAFWSAPCSSKRATVAWWPLWHARCSGVSR